MAAKISKKVRIPLKSGSAASGKTVPGPGSVRGGGTMSTGPGKSSGIGTTGGYGNARGVMSRKNGKSC